MYYSKEEIREAKEADLIELLTKLNVPLRRWGRSYCLEEHDSLKLNGGNLWYWHSKNIGAASTIDYLMKVGVNGKTYTFTEAVELIRDTLYLNKETISNEKNNEEKQALKHIAKAFKDDMEFKKPIRSFVQKRIFAYLVHRGIDYNLLKKIVQKGLLYEEYKTHNCVFLGKDDAGNPKYAYLRGTFSRDDKRFVGEAFGSEKKYGFKLEGENDTVRIFESPIDLLSYITLKSKDEIGQDTYISLGGVSLDALTGYMQKNGDRISKIYVCTDNDKAGERIYEKVSKEYPDKKVIDERPKNAKDYNEELMKKLQIINFEYDFER